MPYLRAGSSDSGLENGAHGRARRGADLAESRVVGLLRSSLIKKPPTYAAPLSAVPDPFALAPTVPVSTFEPLEIGAAAAPPPRPAFDSAPSTSDLLERAAALGPARMTWESIVLPNDPILHEKSTPHVAERRARLTRIVKGALGACVAVCVLALGVSAVSSATSTPDPKQSSASTTTSAKTIPSKVIVPVETLSIAKHGKAASAPAFVVAQARPAVVATPRKRR